MVAEQRKLPGFSIRFTLPPDGSRHSAAFFNWLLNPHFLLYSSCERSLCERIAF
jgi:hypothetical protein